MDLDCESFLRFVKENPPEVSENILERIADVAWNNENADGIKIRETHQINAANQIISGTIMVNNTEFGFQYECGDISGSLMHQWGDPEEVGTYEPRPPDLYTFVPANDYLEQERPGLYKVYLKWKEERWFKEKVNNMNYDFHFQPGLKMREHYRKFAASKGLKISTE